MKLPHKQKGLSSIGWLFVGVTVYFYSIVAIKVVPVYWDDFTVKSTMDKLGKIQGASAYDVPDVVDQLEKEFDINNIRDIDPRKEGAVIINRDTDKPIAELTYEKTATIYKNAGMLQTMELVVKFKHSVVLK